MLLRRFVVAVVVSAGLSAWAAVSTTAVATADQFGCTFYAASQGYSGKIVDIGCADGARGNRVLCLGSLRIAGMPDAIAEEACRRAAL